MGEVESRHREEEANQALKGKQTDLQNSRYNWQDSHAQCRLHTSVQTLGEAVSEGTGTSEQLDARGHPSGVELLEVLRHISPPDNLDSLLFHLSKFRSNP